MLWLIKGYRGKDTCAYMVREFESKSEESAQEYFEWFCENYRANLNCPMVIRLELSRQTINRSEYVS